MLLSTYILYINVKRDGVLSESYMRRHREVIQTALLLAAYTAFWDLGS